MTIPHSTPATHPTDEPLDEPLDDTMPPASIRCIRGLIFLALLLLILYVLAPLPVKYFSPMRDYAAVVDETGIMPGALYYNDVPQTRDAEVNNRDSIRFLVPQRTQTSE